MTNRTMVDGIAALAAGINRDFPNFAGLIAGYLDGSYQWTPADWALFPRAVHVGIVVSAAHNYGDVLDVERYDATPAQTGPWIAMRKAAGYLRPTIYCSLSTVPAVRNGTGAYVLGRDYDIWVAHYDDSPVPDPVPGPGITAGVQWAAKQYRSTPAFDLSAVYDDHWPHRCT